MKIHNKTVLFLFCFIFISTSGYTEFVKRYGPDIKAIGIDMNTINQSDMICAGNIINISESGYQDKIIMSGQEDKNIKLIKQTVKMEVVKTYKGKDQKIINITCYKNYDNEIWGISDGFYLVFLKDEDFGLVPTNIRNFLIPTDINAIKETKDMESALINTIKLGGDSLVWNSAGTLANMGMTSQLSDCNDTITTYGGSIKKGVLLLYLLENNMKDRNILSQSFKYYTKNRNNVNTHHVAYSIRGPMQKAINGIYEKKYSLMSSTTLTYELQKATDFDEKRKLTRALGDMCLIKGPNEYFEGENEAIDSYLNNLTNEMLQADEIETSKIVSLFVNIGSPSLTHMIDARTNCNTWQKDIITTGIYTITNNHGSINVLLTKYKSAKSEEEKFNIIQVLSGLKHVQNQELNYRPTLTTDEFNQEIINVAINFLVDQSKIETSNKKAEYIQKSITLLRNQLSNKITTIPTLVE